MSAEQAEVEKKKNVSLASEPPAWLPVVNVNVEFRKILLGHLTAEAVTEYLILQEAQRKL